MQINQNDLKFFTAHALQGLLANPLYSSMEGQKYLSIKKLTIEALAVRSALETMEKLATMNEVLDQAEIQSATKKMTENQKEGSDGIN